jgi:Transcription factor WhiB
VTLPPDLSAGHCVTGAAGLPLGAWDDGADPAEREAAVHACGSCPVLTECRNWAVTMPGAHSYGGVIGGMMGCGQVQAERARRRGDR